jgi:hypothetical protein
VERMGSRFICLGIMISIAVMLGLCNQQPQPKWNVGLNLKTVVALLATLLRSSLVTVVEEGKCRLQTWSGPARMCPVMSQTKWCWQQRRHLVQHLAYFDKASRGPLGALLLCFRIPALLNIKMLSSGSVFFKSIHC